MKNPKDRQDWILKILERRPNANFKECFSKYSVRYKLSEQTFSKDWKKASARYIEHRKAIELKRASDLAEIEVNEGKNDVLTILEAQKILTKIARGEIEEIDEEKIIPSHKDRINAICELGKMLRWQEVQQLTAIQNITNNNIKIDNMEISDKFFGNFVIEVDGRGI